MRKCYGGRVEHPATHKETVRLSHPEHGKTVESGEICLDHKTSYEDWEVDGWNVEKITRAKL